MRSSLVVRACDCQCTSCNGPGFDTSIRRHSGIWGAADKAVLNIVRKKIKNPPPQKIFENKINKKLSRWRTGRTWLCWRRRSSRRSWSWGAATGRARRSPTRSSSASATGSRLVFMDVRKMEKAVLRIHDILVWIRIRIRILLFSSLTFQGANKKLI